MDDFKRRPINKVVSPDDTSNPAVPLPVAPQGEISSETPSVSSPQVSESQPVPQPISEPSPNKPRRGKKKLVLWSIGVVLLLVLAAVASVWFWYASQLAPVNPNNADRTLVRIESGTTPDGIAAVLKEQDLIRNETAFLWYARSKGVQNSLQAGTYRLSQSESTQEIIDHLTNGNVDTFDITFIPGETLAKNREVFLSAGYSANEVDAAFSAEYSSPLFEGKPATADLEGYIYPDTYKFGAGASVKDILEHIFETYSKAIEDNGLKAKFESHGLTLHEGIVMASIIQKEAVGGDERQIAQVFLKRYSIGMRLGSDPTYQYITDKLGVPRDINYDSPYNTRRYEGIPPGPIANPGIVALKAVADPAPGEYLYFLSGDDDVTYFSNTFEEHEQNIVDHCKVKCQSI